MLTSNMVKNAKFYPSLLHSYYNYCIFGVDKCTLRGGTVQFPATASKRCVDALTLCHVTVSNSNIYHF